MLEMIASRRLCECFRLVHRLNKELISCLFHSLPLLTVREFLMLRFMNVVTDKPEWQKKVRLGSCPHDPSVLIDVEW